MCVYAFTARAAFAYFIAAEVGIFSLGKHFRSIKNEERGGVVGSARAPNPMSFFIRHSCSLTLSVMTLTIQVALSRNGVTRGFRFIIFIFE